MARKKTIFLCWSGTRSKRVAKALQRAIAGLDELGWRAKRSPEIAKGSLWFGQILEDLGHADAAIVCLTPENVNNPWMHFEAGAIVAKLRDDATRCSGDCESAESDALADAIAAFRRIVDKACSCGDDETCAAEVHADYQTWARGPGSTGDRGSDAQAAEIGAELQRLMECDAELGRRVLSR